MDNSYKKENDHDKCSLNTLDKAKQNDSMSQHPCSCLKSDSARSA